MFISKLVNSIESYDQYGIRRVDGLKTVYLMFVLFFFNFVFVIPDPYFYYFFIPVVALLAEVLSVTLREKFLQFGQCILLTTLTVFVFHMFSPYWFFFIVVFFYSLCLYFIAIRNRWHTLVLAPTVLALGTYALLFENLNMNFYDVFNHCMTIMFAASIVLLALFIFPRGYYYRIWLKAFLLSIRQLIDHLVHARDYQPLAFDAMQTHTLYLNRYAHMLPQSPPIYSILKINMLIHHLFLTIVTLEKNTIILDAEKINQLIDGLRLFAAAIEKEKPCRLKTSFRDLQKLINSWNYICSTL